MPVTLINPFVVPAEKEEEFLREWNNTTAIFCRAAGFISTHLHKSLNVGDKTYQYVNIALWASVEAWEATRTSYKPGEQSIPGIEHHPGIFREFITVRNPNDTD